MSIFFFHSVFPYSRLDLGTVDHWTIYMRMKHKRRLTRRSIQLLTLHQSTCPRLTDFSRLVPIWMVFLLGFFRLLAHSEIDPGGRKDYKGHKDRKSTGCHSINLRSSFHFLYHITLAKSHYPPGIHHASHF